MTQEITDCLNRLMVAGNHLASLIIQRGLEPYSVTVEQYLEKHGPGEDFDIWVAWKRIMELRDALNPGVDAL